MGADVTLRSVVLLGLALVALSCGSDDDAGVVTARDLGADWPLTVDSATLACDGSDGMGDATATVNGKTYALNGLAKGAGLPPIDEIWKADPDLPGLKKSIGPLIDRALELC